MDKSLEMFAVARLKILTVKRCGSCTGVARIIYTILT